MIVKAKKIKNISCTYCTNFKGVTSALVANQKAEQVHKTLMRIVADKLFEEGLIDFKLSIEDDQLVGKAEVSALVEKQSKKEE